MLLPVAAHAAITFVPGTDGRAFTVAGDATDLSGLGGSATDSRLGAFGSDLFYDSASDTYFGVADRGPGGGVLDFTPRIQGFKLDIDANSGAIRGFQLVSTTLLSRADGQFFNGKNPGLLNGNPSVLGLSFDPEGLTRRANGNFLLADEYGPSLYEFSPNGVFIRAFTPPANLIPRRSDGTIDYVAGRGTIVSGRQDNRGYEGLTLSPDGTRAYAVLQDPLVGEGSGGDGRRSRNVRIVEYDVDSGEPLRQFIYQLESRDDINARIPGTANDFGATAQGRNIGVSSITALADGSFLLIERDNRGLGEADPTAALPVGSKRVYRIRLDGATDVSGVSLAGTNDLPAGVVPVQKSLYLDVAAAIGPNNVAGEKLEGLTFGRQLADGSLNMILITDNDMSVNQPDGSTERFDVCTSGPGGSFTLVQIGAACPAGQSLIPTTLYSFRVSGADAVGVVPEPSSWAMMISGFALVGLGLRRRATRVRFA
nr:esterase-like activity of phytase family protein [Sphingomonas changnyeongensis]